MTLPVHQIEEEIEIFVENFKKRNSMLDLNLCAGATDISHNAASPDDGGQDTGSIFAYSAHRYRYLHTSSRKLSTDETRSDAAGSSMDEASLPCSVLHVAELLQTRYIFYSGGRAKNGAPILTFSDTGHHNEISDIQFKQVVSYICSIPTYFEDDYGFVIVIDKRQDSWGATKSLLLKISNLFPSHVQVVFLLQPKGFFQRAFSDFRSKFVREELSFKVVVCSSADELFVHIDASQLTTDVGGDIEYDHNEWIEHRAAIEKFSSNTNKISKSTVSVAKRLEETELPNEVEDTEALIHDHILERKELKEDLSSAARHGHTLMGCIMGDNSDTPLVKEIHVTVLQKLLSKLDESQKFFDEFWRKHETKLRQCLKLRKFEEEFKLLQFTVERHLECVEKKMTDAGDSLNRVEMLLSEFNAFEVDAEKDMEHADRLRAQGDHLIQDDHYAVDSIRPKCVELQRMCEQYKQLLRRRREILTKSHDLQVRIDKANKWCTRGVDLLANQPIERYQQMGEADQAMEDIEAFLSTASELKLNNPKEFRALFQSMITVETKGVVQAVLRRIEDVQGMFAKRQESLMHMTGKQPRPVQLVQPVQQRLNVEPESCHIQASPSLSRAATSGKSARLHSKISNASDYSRGTDSCDSAHTYADIDTLFAKRKHVLNELIETEKIYVDEMHDILVGYFSEMENPQFQHLLPDILINQREVLFGNLEEIYRFHSNIFLHDLQNCRDTPSKVGCCFVKRKEEFQMYSTYCMNKPRSESLRMQIGDSNPFFKECQKKLGHKLPLGAYLLKPVQRITKYQLLLKKMLAYTEGDSLSSSQLQDALETMLSLLKYVNDVMHQIAIVGFNGNLVDQGRLLMQGSFNVWAEHKKDKLRDLRFKPMCRHLFLYDKSMLLCKQKGDQQMSGKAVYRFKNLLKMSQVGLTENIKGDKRKFELWLRGREEVYTIQAPSIQDKAVWVKEIKQVLLNQFDQLKVNRLNITQKSQDDLTKISRGPEYLDTSNKYSNTVNNNPTIPIGLEMKSPTNEIMDQESWSSEEFSNSDEESNEQFLSNVEPSYLQQFISLGDYNAVQCEELTLQEGDILEILRIGSNGWWYAKHLGNYDEGWVPSTYLESIGKRHSKSLASTASLGSYESLGHGGRSSPRMSHSSSSGAYSGNSVPVGETTV